MLSLSQKDQIAVLKACRKAEQRAYLKAAMVYPLPKDAPLDFERLREQFNYQLRLEAKFKKRIYRKFKLTPSEVILLENRLNRSGVK